MNNLRLLIAFIGLVGLIGTGFVACSPEPPLHLYDAQEATMDLPIVDLDLDVYWDYQMEVGIDYEWAAEWYYGWD